MERVTFETLPPEMRFNILRFLDRRSLLNACCVSKAWYGLISPVTFVWERACRDLGLQLREGIQDKMCRALFVRLSQRVRSIAEASSFDKKCFADERAKQVTAIYYHDGRLATGSRCGLVTLWRCPAYSRVWVSEQASSCVTSVKFDDFVLAASYSDGTVRTFDPSVGRCTMTYAVPDGSREMASSVDYATDADLVVGAGGKILVWEMSSGRLVEVKTPHSGPAARVLVGPYPGADDGGSDGRKTLLVAARLLEHVMLWQVTSEVDDAGQREVTMEVQIIIWADCLHHQDGTPAGDELFFDGEYLYFTKRSPENCNGVVIQWDVANGRIATEILFESKLTVLLGVGEKYMLAATSDNLLVDNLDVIERQTYRILMRTRIIRFPTCYNEPAGDIFCLGRRSWLDGFDGENDYGPFAIFVLHPNFIHVLEWNVLNWTYWIRHTQRNFRLC